MLIEWYLAKIFTIRVLLLTAGLVFTAIMFEGLMAKHILEWCIALIKIPFLIHKSLPFLVFSSTLLFLWRLIRSHEWEALSSAGLSLWNLLSSPLLITFILSMGDLFFLAPLGQRLLSPLLFKEDHLSLKGEGWHTEVKDNHYSLFFWHNNHFHAFRFSSQSDFQQHLMATQVKPKGSQLILERGWDIRPNQMPLALKGLPIPLPGTKLNQHPSFMSFLEIKEALPHSQPQKKILLLRQGYLLTNAFWILTLIPLAASILVGPLRGRYRLLMVIGGLGACFTIYVGKEWLYALSLPLSYALKPLVLWAIPTLTLLGALGILFEKKEF